MVLNNCAGEIPSYALDTEQWAIGWFKKAIEAQKSGKKLLIYEVSESEIHTDTIGYEMGKAQTYACPIAGIDHMLFDITFLNQVGQ